MGGGRAPRLSGARACDGHLLLVDAREEEEGLDAQVELLELDAVGGVAALEQQLQLLGRLLVLLQLEVQLCAATGRMGPMRAEGGQAAEQSAGKQGARLEGRNRSGWSY